MKKALLVPLLLPVVGFGLVKGFYWYQVKGIVDRLVAQAAPLIEIRYDSVIADFNGTAGIEGVSVHHVGTGQAFSLERVVVDAGSWTRFIGGLDKLKAEALPDTAGIQLHGVEIPLAALGGGFDGLTGIVPGCLPADQQGPTWQELGVDTAEANLAAGYRFNPLTGYLNVDMSIEAPALLGGSVGLSIDTGSKVLSNPLNALPMRLSELSVMIHQAPYYQRRNQYCARLNGESVAEFVNRHVALMAQRWPNRGADLNPSWVEGYRAFLMASGNAELRLVAKHPLVLSGLGAAELADQVAVVVSVNGHKVEPLDWAWLRPAPAVGDGGLLKVADLSVPAGASVVVETPMAPELAPSPGGGLISPEGYQLTRVQRTAKPVFEEVAISELADYIGATLQIDTLNGHRIEGQLESLVRNQLRIRQKLEGGVALLPIRFDLIQVIRVLR